MGKTPFLLYLGVASITLMASLGLTPSSHAEPPPDKAAQADALFQEGNDLVAAGEIEKACPKFAESHAADPSYGAILNLGECYLLLKKTASAYTAFREAAELARQSKSPARVNEATSRAAAVEPGLHRLTITVKAPPAGLAVTRDGSEVPLSTLGTPVAVDPGQHTLTATAPGRKPFSKTLTLTGEGKTTTLEVTLALMDTTPVTTSPSGQPRTFPPERIGALAALGVAIAAGVTGGILGEEARSKWERAQPGCNANNQCTPDALALGNEARSFAHGATAAWIVAGAAAAGAVVLWLTSPSVTRIQRGKVSLGTGVSVSPEGGTVTLQGRF